MKKLQVMLIIILGFGLAGCHPKPPVVQAIQQASKEVNQGHIVGALSWISEDFEGNGGEMNKDRLQSLMQFTKVGQQQVKIETSEFKVKTYPKFTQVRFKLKVMSANKGISQIFRGATYQVNSAWVEKNGRWQCQGADWQLENGTGAN